MGRLGGQVRKLAFWAGFLAVYLLLAGSGSLSELGAGAGAAAIATWFFTAWSRTGRRRFRLAEARWGRLLAGPLAALLPEAGRVGLALLRTLLRRPPGHLGRVQVQPFRHGGDDPAQAGRRGLVTLALCVAPNGYVLDLPDGSSTLLVHRLWPAPSKEDAEWPV